MSRPQRDLELEAAVGIAQLVAEQILHLAQPVPGRLRVHVRMLRHLVGVAAVLEPGQQRLGQPILLGGAKALQRGEPGRPQGASQLLVGEDEQGGQVLVAAHQVLPAVAGLGPGAGGRGPGGPVARWPGGPGAGSGFLAQLNAGGDTVSGVSYMVIESRDDEVVTPYTSAFLMSPGVTDITVQNQCPLDQSDHLELVYDPVAMADMLNALNLASRVSVPCVPVLPVTGPVGPVLLTGPVGPVPPF
jgi:hypothetical protein